MNTRYSPNFRLCGTCSFWTGQRSLTIARTHVEIADGTFGDCNVDRVKKTHKMHNAMCNKWQVWGHIKDSDKIVAKEEVKKVTKLSGGTTSSGSKRGSIPYPVFSILLVMATIISFISKYLDYFKNLAFVIIPCVVVCFLINKFIKKPKFKIIVTAVLGIIISLIIVLNTSRGRINIREQREKTVQTIKTSTVRGYKPTFGTGNAYSTNIDKIVVKGHIEYSAYDDYYCININDAYNTGSLQLDTNSVNVYFQKATGSNAIKSSSMGIFGLFFLTKTNTSYPIRYILDDIIEYKYADGSTRDFRSLVDEISSTNLMEYTDKQVMNGIPILDTWILNNLK